ncbi:hypothetical protein ACHAP8_010336 [Fusarium lateritium]
MSGIEVIGLIGSIVGIVQFIAEVSNALKNAKDLPEAFQEVGDRIALVQDILQKVENNIDRTADDGTYQAVRTILEDCKDKAKQLEAIFQAVASTDKTPRIKRYALVVKRLGKGKRVEVLAKGMIEDTQLLVMEHTAQAATEDQLTKLADAIEVLSEIEPSLPEEGSITQNHSGSGDNVAGNKYQGNHNDIKAIHGNPIFGNVTNNNGKPGSGKSTLLRYARDSFTAMQKDKHTPLVLSFFFNGRGNKLQKSEEGMFRSLLCQIQSELPEALKDLQNALKWREATSKTPNEVWQWAPGSLCQHFQKSLWLALKTHPVVLFIDALDESGESNAKLIADEFDSLIQRASVSNLKSLHICFTCRHYPILDLGGVLQISMETENRKDISLFVERSLASFIETTDSDLALYIEDYAEGVFLWAYLVVNKVIQLDRDRIDKVKIEAEVRRIPRKLDDFYTEVAQNMDLCSAELIEWICFASRPLTLTELRWSITSSRTSRDSEVESWQEMTPCNDAGMLKDIQILGRGLIEYQQDSDVVQFYHQSVKDFFVEKGLALLRNITGPQAITAVAEGAHHNSTNIGMIGILLANGAKVNYDYVPQCAYQPHIGGPVAQFLELVKYRRVRDRPSRY